MAVLLDGVLDVFVSASGRKHLSRRREIFESMLAVVRYFCVSITCNIGGGGTERFAMGDLGDGFLRSVILRAVFVVVAISSSSMKK